MTLQPEAVTVAGTGTVWVAPEGTPMPTDLAELTSPWLDLGYVSEDGVTFTLSRDSSDINAWQSSDPVRVLTTAEPKNVAFELLEFDPDSILLALRGGTFSTTGVAPDTIALYTPPGAGATDVRALTIDAIDGAEQWRFCIQRAQIQGDVAWQLVRSDAVRLPLEMGVLSAEPWGTILSNAADWVAGPTVPAAASSAKQPTAKAA
jgi:hypothetical protein